MHNSKAILFITPVDLALSLGDATVERETLRCISQYFDVYVFSLRVVYPRKIRLNINTLPNNVRLFEFPFLIIRRAYTIQVLILSVVWCVMALLLRPLLRLKVFLVRHPIPATLLSTFQRALEVHLVYRVLSVPYLHTEIRFDPSFQKNILLRVMEKIIRGFDLTALRKSGSIVASSETAKIQIPRKKNVYVIPFCVNEKFFEVDKRPSDEYFVIGYFGDLYKLYDFEPLVIAIKELQSKISDLRMLIYGNGVHTSTRKRIQKLVKQYSLEEAVKMSMLIPHSQVPSILGSLDCVVLPFRKKVSAVSIKALEALATGVPVIICGRHHEFFMDHKNCLVVPNDVTSLREAILKLYLDKILREYICLNARRSARFFRRDVVAPLYKHLVDLTIK